MRVALLTILLLSSGCYTLASFFFAHAPGCITGLHRWRDVEVFEGDPPAGYEPVRQLEVRSEHPDQPTGEGWMLDALKMAAYACNKRDQPPVVLARVNLAETWGTGTVYAKR